ncbi:MAG TPA: hypothetical protein PLE54_08950 [Burkholderiaceae bacterium]|nr:hypothetical protein [Burkholderiaceae bacterium]HQR70718.1 hypothetical protein [Burkholderiaceae bacterium]
MTSGSAAANGPADAALGAVAAGVQANCDLADALHARDKSLCTYLLGMREYFRWAAQLPLGAVPDRARLSAWIAQREHEWDTLHERSDAGYGELPLAGGIDPFDEEAVNRELQTEGVVYGAGFGLFGAPMFFLARRESEHVRDGIRVIVAGAELARGVTAAPATSRGGTIVIRTDALRRWLWTRAEAARRGSNDTAFARALRAYDADSDATAAVECMARGETETLVLHELGELRAGDLLGAEWEEMLLAAGDRRTEVVLRAVRDLLADCLVTLPALAARQATPSLHFWIANFDGMRRALAPELADPFREPDRVDRAGLVRAAETGTRLWHDRASELLAHWRRGGIEAVQQEASRLAGTH